MSQFNPILTMSVLAAGTIVAERFIRGTGVQAAAGQNARGVARSAGVAGQMVPVDVLGTAIVEAGAAIPNDTLVEADAQGRAITRTTGQILGRSCQAATGAGSRIEILLIPN